MDIQIRPARVEDAPSILIYCSICQYFIWLLQSCMNIKDCDSTMTQYDTVL